MSAVSSDNLEIPLIDFSHFTSGEPSLKQQTARSILQGFQRAGFIYLRNHGIPRSSIASTFASSAKFFTRSEEEKLSLGWTTPAANRGYSQPGREKTTDSTDPEEIARIRNLEGVDLKESFEIGREGVEGCPNQWPKEDEAGKEFKETTMDFFEAGRKLHLQVLKAVACGLGIEEDWFERSCGKGDNTLRLLHYPPVRSEVFKGNKNTVRAGAHTDYGSMTLLFQDMAGGLEVLSPNGNYVPATPIEDTIVVNAGDLLARWSNDVIKSTKHRVVQPPTDLEVYPARYSIAYFCNPNSDAFIETIPSTFDESRPKKYEGVNSGEYLVQRLTATY
ncbi:unnamed protein product [Zymoseptoria tritici ST99CH_1A5]|uniref:Fe2OG dioxygenase domain-containing protein n=1 Tax=Zymoseptoria tritici ST99CH_1A5 TaxID=1276529 RepID=A0A1Y6LAE4_ZYMTR|nr:unnamed protein product [Zymoseptoria tritici ST99CH_1A5]